MADAASKAAQKREQREQRDGVNVQVLLRCRPPNSQEIAERAPQVIQCNEALREVTMFQNAAGKQVSRTFHYDKVFSPKTGQEKLFTQAIVPIVDEVLDGFNCTIFAYGQTGTGKTYTMEGGPRNSSDGTNLSAEAGVIPRSIRYIFDTIEGNSDSTVKVSFLELYNEELTDLLATSDDKDKRLRLLEDRSGVVVQGLEEVVVKSAEEIYQVLDRGTAKRRTAETLLNKRSSRSHSVFTITIHMREVIPEGDDVIKIGKLNLVDLAGSENISRSGAKDDRAREAGSINQSLLTLGRVITALVEHCGHVPYRDSKLTRLLRDSLGGRTKTCIIATIGPSVQCQEETISTLDYAHRAKNIRNRPEVNQKISKGTMIKELTAEIAKLKADLVATREKNGVYMSQDSFEAGELERAQLRQRVMSLEAEMEQTSGETRAEMEKREAAHVQQLADLQGLLQGVRQELQGTQAQLAAARLRIEEQEFLVSSHERSEAAVVQHAEALNSELEGTRSDLEALFGKLEQLVTLQNGDRKVMKTVADYAAQKLSALQAAVQQQQGKQQQVADKMHQHLAAYQAGKEVELQELAAQLQGMNDAATKLLQSSSQHVSTMSQAAGLGFSSLADASKAFCQESTRSLQQAYQSGTAAVSAAQQSLDAGIKRFQAFSEQQRLEAERAAAWTQHTLQQLDEQLSSTHQQASSLLNQTSEAHQAQLDALDSLAAKCAEVQAAKQQQLVQQVEQLLRGFAQQNADMLSEVATTARSQLTSQHNIVSSGIQQIGEGLTATSTATQDATKAAAEASATSVSQLQIHAAKTQAELQSCSTANAAVQKQLDAFCSEAAKSLTGHEQVASGIATKAQAAVQQQAQQVQELLSTSTRASGKSLACLAENIKSCNSNDKQVAFTASQLSTDTHKALAGFMAAQQDDLSSVASNVTQDVDAQLQARVDFSTLPGRRTEPVPSPAVIHSKKCPPPELIIGTFRRQRSAVVQSGGDPRQLFDLLTPGKMRQPHSGQKVSLSPPVENMLPLDSCVTPPAKVLASKPSRIPGVGAPGSNPYANVTPRGPHVLADRTNH